MFLIFSSISRAQIKIVFFKIRLDKRIFEHDFSRYNKVLNKIYYQFKLQFEYLGRDYISIYLFNNFVISDNFTLKLLFELINNNNLFDIII